MKLINKTLALFAAAAILVPLVANAQYKLPQKHNKQHSELLASQKPMAADIKVVNVLKYMSDLSKPELPDQDEVYGEYWVSQSVNPYVGVSIPEVKDLDVSGYYHPIVGPVTSGFGYRPRFGRIHRGVDISLHVGDTIRAAFDGKVRMTKFDRGGYGYYVVIRHDNGMETVYGHLSKFIAKPDQRVKAGDPIALGGNTGRSTGPHLHFETRYYGLAINPQLIIDFENGVPIKDSFTFNKAAVEKSNLGRRVAKRTTRSKARTTASRKRTSTKR
ncbi:MAG: M23 family metallopeptidase [Paramuribaculum sp.]|nr:M23 family metallopeptidase [Paramuribaculum sp.]